MMPPWWWWVGTGGQLVILGFVIFVAVKTIRESR